jgi:Ca-activated chloride channel family protein
MMFYLLLVSLNISPLVNKANKLYNKEKYEDAYELYKKASILYPDNEEIKFNLSDCAYKLKRYREAADGFVRLSMSKDIDLREKSFYNIGNTFMEVGQFGDAISSYKQALLLKPNDLRAKRNLEIAKLMQQEQKKQEEKEEEQEDEEEQQEKQEREDRTQSQIMEALEADQKEIMEEALQKQTGGRKEAGRW